VVDDRFRRLLADQTLQCRDALLPGARLALACHNNADIAARQIVEAPNVDRVAGCDQQGEASIPGENPRLGFDP
jgi:hypothetical protein